MKQWFRKCFRYPAQDILLLISFCVAAFFVLFFSFSSEKLRKFENERYPYTAVTEIYSLGYYGSGPAPEEWTQALEEKKYRLNMEYIIPVRIDDFSLESLLLPKEFKDAHILNYLESRESFEREVVSIIRNVRR